MKWIDLAGESNLAYGYVNKESTIYQESELLSSSKRMNQQGQESMHASFFFSDVGK